MHFKAYIHNFKIDRAIAVIFLGRKSLYTLKELRYN